MRHCDKQGGVVYRQKNFFYWRYTTPPWQLWKGDSQIFGHDATVDHWGDCSDKEGCALIALVHVGENMIQRKVLKVRDLQDGAWLRMQIFLAKKNLRYLVLVSSVRMLGYRPGQSFAGQAQSFQTNKIRATLIITFPDTDCGSERHPNHDRLSHWLLLTRSHLARARSCYPAN